MSSIKFAADGRDIHVDVPLSNVAVDHRPQGMIADMIAPVVTVGKQSDRIAIFSRDEALRNENAIRAPGAEANKISRSVSSETFFCNNYALKQPVTIENRENADPIYRSKLYNRSAEYVTGKIILGWETRVAAQVTSTSNVGSSAAVASGWTDHTNSDPLGNVNAAIDNVQDATGLRPNRIIFGDAAWRNFRRNTAIRNLISGVNNGGGYANMAQVKELLEMEWVGVGGAYQNTAAEGQTGTLSQVWGDNVLVYFAPMNASVDDPSFMYTFRWTAPGLPNMQAERHPFDRKTKTEEVEVGMYQDEKIVGSEYAYLLTAVNSST